MKTTEKPQGRPAGIPCFECGGGTLQPVQQDYPTNHPKFGSITIPAVPMLRCGSCGETVIGEEGNNRIDSFLDNALSHKTRLVSDSRGGAENAES